VQVIDWNQHIISETSQTRLRNDVLMGMLNPTQSLTHSLCVLIWSFVWHFQLLYLY